MYYQLDIMVSNIEDNKFVKTDCFFTFDPKCAFDAIWTYLRTHKDMGQKKKTKAGGCRATAQKQQILEIFVRQQ